MGLYALFGDERALDIFFSSVELGLFSTITLNWLGMAYAQYERSVDGVTKFSDSDNLIAMGINLSYNLLSFGLHLWL